MSGRQAVLLAARREFRERFRARAFRASLAVQVVIVVAIIVIASLTGSSGPKKIDVGTAGPEASAIGKAAKAQQDALDLDITLKSEADESAARQAVEDGDLDAAVTENSLLTGTDPDAKTVAVLQSAAREVRSLASLDAAGVPEPAAKQALDPPLLQSQRVEGKGGNGGKGLAFIGTLLLYIAIISFGYAVATGVVEEKSSRVIEVVLSAIRPAQLLAGKVIGIGVLGLLQMVVIVGAGLVAALGLGELDLPNGTASAAVLVIAYFLLGYAFYACAFAVAGAIVSRQEDTQSTTSPLLAVLIGGYIAAATAIQDPGGTLAEVLTFLPPVAPMVVPGRAAQGELPLGELVLSLVLMVAGTLLMMRIAVGVYERNVLRMGAPLKLRQALRPQDLSPA